MEKSKRFFQKSVFVCVLMAFMAFSSSVWGEIAPAQQDKLNQINDLMAQLGTEGLTEQQKIGIIAQIMSMTEGLASDAKISGNTDLASAVLGIVSSVTDSLPAIIDASSDNITALTQLGDIARTAAQITQTVAETARAAGNANLAQQTVAVAQNLNNVNAQVANAAQNIASTSSDANTVTAANALVQNSNATSDIASQAIQTSLSAGASLGGPGSAPSGPPAPAPADQSSGGSGTPTEPEASPK